MKKLTRDAFLDAGKAIDRLKRAMQKNMLPVGSDQELARFLGVGQQTISSYRSRNKVPYELIMEQCNMLGLSLDEIIFDRETIAKYWIFPPFRRFPSDRQVEPTIPIPEDRKWHILFNRAARALEGPGLILVEMDDDAMTPTLVMGDLLVVDIHGRPETPGIYLLAEGEKFVVRRLIPGDITKIIYDNPAYPPETMSAKKLKVAGKVLKALKDVR